MFVTNTSFKKMVYQWLIPVILATWKIRLRLGELQFKVSPSK
jgi:hypothetical protein